MYYYHTVTRVSRYAVSRTRFILAQMSALSLFYSWELPAAANTSAPASASAPIASVPATVKKADKPSSNGTAESQLADELRVGSVRETVVSLQSLYFMCV